MYRYLFLVALGALPLLACAQTDNVFLVRDIYVPRFDRDQNWSRPSDLRAFGNQLIFTADDPNFGMELFITDGTEEGTRLLTNINPTFLYSQSNSEIEYLGLIGDTLYHQAYEFNFGRELYATNLVTGVSRRITDLNPGGEDASPRGGTLLNGKLLFHAQAPGLGREWYSYDPATGEVTFLGDVNPGTGSGSPFFGGAYVFGDRAYFAGTTPETGTEIFYTDGTPGSIRLFDDAREGSMSGFRDISFGTYRGALYFPSNRAGSGMEPFRSLDGEPETIELFGNVNFSASGSNPEDFAVVDDAFFFSGISRDRSTGSSRNDGRELFYTRGDSADFQKLFDFAPIDSRNVEYTWYGYLDSPRGPRRRLVTVENSPVAGMYAIFATPNETGLVPVPGTADGAPADVVTRGEVAYFSMEVDGNRQLYRYRSGARDVEQLTDFNPPRFGSRVRNLTIAGNYLYFTANSIQFGEELFALALDNPVVGRLAVVEGADTLAAGTILEFVDVVTETAETRTLSLENTGKAAITYALALRDSLTAFRLIAEPLSGRLEPGERTNLDVVFASDDRGSFTNELDIRYVSDGSARDTLTVSYALRANAILSSITNHGLPVRRVYPNPSSDVVWVELDQHAGPVDYTLTDVSGRAVLQGHWPADGRRSVRLAGLPDGVYVLLLRGPGGYSVVRVVRG